VIFLLSRYLFRILISHKTGEFPLLYPIFFLIRQQQLAGQLVMLTEVQTSMPIMWQTGLQLGSHLAAFPIIPIVLDHFLPILKINPFHPFWCRRLWGFLFYLKKKKKKEKKKPFYTSSLYHPFIIKNLIFIKKLSMMSHQIQLFNKNQFFKEKKVIKGG
jgi:hypothetical protein